MQLEGRNDLDRTANTWKASSSHHQQYIVLIGISSVVWFKLGSSGAWFY